MFKSLLDRQSPAPLVAVIIIYLIYFCQGMLYEGDGSFIGQALFALILAFGMWCFVNTLFRIVNPACVWVLAIFFILNGITYVVSPKNVYGYFVGNITTMGQFKGIAFFCLMFFIGYYYSITKNISNKLMSNMGLVILLVYICKYFYNLNLIMTTLMQDEVVNNSAYTMVGMIPFVPLFFKEIKSNIVKVGIAGVILILIIMGSKRGAVLTAAVSCVIYISFYFNQLKRNPKYLGLLILGTIILVLFFTYQVQQNELLMERVESGNSSGREGAYAIMWNYWLHKATELQFLFGSGSAATVWIWGNFGHNDWLELLCDNGLLGAVIYLMLYITVLRFISRHIHDKSFKLLSYLVMFQLFMRSLYSMGYMGYDTGMDMLLLGYVIAKSCKDNLIESDKTQIQYYDSDQN